MTEWAVVGDIVVLVGLVASIVKPMLQLNTTLTTLTSQVQQLVKSFSEFVDKSRRSHDKLHSRIDEADDKLNDHERRITKLETKDQLRT